MKRKGGLWLDAQRINSAIAQPRSPDQGQIDYIIAKSLELTGLSFDDVAVLGRTETEELLAPVFAAAKKVKEAIFPSTITAWRFHCCAGCWNARCKYSPTLSPHIRPLWSAARHNCRTRRFSLRTALRRRSPPLTKKW